MRRFLRVLSLTLGLYIAGLLVVALATAFLVSTGATGLASSILAASLAILVVVAPLVAGTLVPGAPKRVLPTPQDGGDAIDPQIFLWLGLW